MNTLSSHNPCAYIPQVDRSECKGCGHCVTACTKGVLELHSLSDLEMQAIPSSIRRRVAGHGNQQAFVARPDPCDGCGLCVKHCRKHAISLIENHSATRNMNDQLH